MKSAGIIGVHTFCVVAVAVFVACSRSFILLNIFAHVRISFAHTHPARALPCNRSLLALSFYYLPSASTIRSTALRNTCIYAQVRLSWRFGLAPFIAYSGTYTSLARCHTCCLCAGVQSLLFLLVAHSPSLRARSHSLASVHV